MSGQIASGLARGIKVSYYILIVFTALILALSVAGSFLSLSRAGTLLSYLTFSNILLAIVLFLPILFTNLLVRKIKNNKWDKGLIMLFAYYQVFFTFILFFNTKIDENIFKSVWAILIVALILFVLLSLLFNELLSLPNQKSILALLLSLNIILIIFFIVFSFSGFIGIFALPMILFFSVMAVILVRDISCLNKNGNLFLKKK